MRERADGPLLALPSDPRHLREARRMISRTALGAGLTSSQAHDLAVAFSEVCANVHRHAYGGRPDGRVWLGVTVREDAVVVSIAHEGEPFEPKRHAEPDLTRPRESGYGTYLIARLVDAVSFERAGAGGRVVLLKRRAPGGVMSR